MSNSTTLIRLHSLGDIVLAQPAATLPAKSGNVYFITRERYVPVVERMPGDIDPVPFPEGAGALELRRILTKLPPEGIIDLQNNLTTRAALLPRRPDGRFRMDRKQRRKVIRGAGAVMPLRSLDFLRAAGVSDISRPTLDRREYPLPENLTVGIVTGGRWPLKTIPDGVIAETCRLLIDLHGARIVLLGGAEDRKRAMDISRSAGRRGIEICAGAGGVDLLIENIERLNLLIAPDSGPAHLAHALRVPVLVLFTSTAPALGFWEEDFKGAFMAPDVSCRPCHRHGGRRCKTGTEACRKRIIPWTLVKRAMKLVDR